MSGSAGALLVSQCNVVWRSFLWAGGSGYQGFASSWWFFVCQVWLQHLSEIFDLQSSHCLLPPSSHHLGSLCLYNFNALNNTENNLRLKN
jgi:hypothetical protein